MPKKPAALIDALMRTDGWISSSQLSQTLGVSHRSVRIHVAAARNIASPFRVIESSKSGYRLNKREYDAFMSSARGSRENSPRQDRLRFMIRALSLAPEGIALEWFASELFVSGSTVEADLRKLRTLADGMDVTVGRKENVLILTGTWSARRRLLSSVFRADGAVGYLEHQAMEMNGIAARLRRFKTGVIGWIESTGRGVNEHGIASVLLHVAIAVDRADHHIRAMGERGDHMPESEQKHLAGLIRTHFDVDLLDEDLDYLAELLESRAITHADHASSEADDGTVILMTRRILDAVCTNRGVDIIDPTVASRLGRHIENMLTRARSGYPTRNPFMQSIKFSHPVIYDVAVEISRLIEAEQQVTIAEDEISFIALHLGLAISPKAIAYAPVTTTLVCPSYWDMTDVLKTRIDSEFGADISIVSVVCRTDVDPSELTEDLVLTTFPLPGAPDTCVQIHPFLTDQDRQNIRAKISAIRKRALSATTDNYFRSLVDPTLFIGELTAATPASAIAQLGDLMVRAGVADADFVNDCMEREKRSPSVFATDVAFPHATNARARRTTVGLGILTSPMVWGDQSVRLVALVNFSPTTGESSEIRLDDVVGCFRDLERVKVLASSLINNATMPDTEPPHV